MSRRFPITVVLKTREEAENVLDALQKIGEKNKWASVSQLFELINQTGHYSYVKLGWAYWELNQTQIKQTEDGWIIDFPDLSVVDGESPIDTRIAL